MSRKSLLERLNDSALWTGLLTLAEGRVRPRPTRWQPILALILGLAGFAVALARPDRFFTGLVLLLIGTALALLVQAWGLVKPLLAPETLGERDRLVRGRAYELAFLILATTLPISLVMLGGIALANEWDTLRLSRTVSAAGLLAFTLVGALPTLIASWTAPRLVHEDDYTR